MIFSVPGHASPGEPYAVPLMVSEVRVQRVGSVLFRYLEFFEDYPCIRFETLQPPRLKLIDRVEACRFTVDGRTIDVRNKGLAGVGYKGNRLENNVFCFAAHIVVGGSGPGLPPLSCSVVIAHDGKLTGPSCQPEKESSH